MNPRAPCLSPRPGRCQAERPAGESRGDHRPGAGTAGMWSDTGEVTVTAVLEDKADVQT